MSVAPRPSSERQRLTALEQLELLDTEPEPTFDALTRLAARLLRAPMALVSLVGEDRQWFKSRVGVELPQTPRDEAFCAHAILHEAPMVVADATLDARFASNPLVLGPPGIRAYLGIPLRTSAGHALGTLCVLDRRPRSFSAQDIASMEDLACLVRREIQHREAMVRARRLAGESMKAVSASETLYHATFDRAAVGIAVVGLDGSWLRINPCLARILGRTQDELSSLTFQDLTHPDDLNADLGLVEQLLAGEIDHYTLEKRYLKPHGEVVWANLTVTLVKQDGGTPLHFVSVVEDITRRHHGEQALHRLRLELEQRVVERTQALQEANDGLAASIRQLQQSEEALAERTAELNAVLTNAHDAYICIDGQGLIVEWNRQAEATFGWSCGEAMGRPLDALIIPPAFRAAHRAGVQRLASTGDERVVSQRLEMTALRRDGTAFTCEATIAASPSRSRGPLYAAFLHDISARKEAERRLADANARLEDLYQNAPCGYYSLDRQGVFVQINERSLELFGCAREALIGRKGPRDFFTEAGRARFAEVYARFLVEGRFGPEEFDLLSGDGCQRRLSVMATALRDEHGAFLRSRTVVFDVTELHRVRQALQEANRQQHLMLDNELVAIVKLKDRRAVWVNRAFEQMFGFAPGEFDGGAMRTLYDDEDSFEQIGRSAYGALARGETYRTQVGMLKKTGERLWVDMSGALLSSDSGESLWMMHDITHMKLQQQEVEDLAYHDALTGLPNRTLLKSRLVQALGAAQRAGNHVAACFLDLDGFKAVNDVHGHEAGDRLLCEVARRLAGIVRGHDTVARLGGDEFVLVLTQLASPNDVHVVVERAERAIAAPVEIGPGLQARVGGSFGVAVATAGIDATALLAQADVAMYEVKRRRKQQPAAAPAA
ncbi:PAS domain S-box protein [Aquincola sp. MAHUQ-54]|uniref:PAS domain S-box protein n=1 Tax=Aquincola agrisoli TaxID=3119538 RepID=A0AAW9QBR1_9BURK